MKPLRAFTAIFLCATTLATPVHAEGYPDHAIRIVVTLAAGGGLDIFARSLAEDLSREWNVPIVVEDRPGGGGLIGATSVAQAAADGYTLLALTDTLLVANRFAFKKLPYDPDKSFTPISLMAQGDQLLVVSESLPVHDWKEFLAYAKANPLTYGHWGGGSSPQLFYETMNHSLGTQILGIPYKGSVPVMQALMGNEIQLSVVSAMTGAALLQSGKLRPIASASNSRSPAYPNLPTTAELGQPELKAYIWFGLVGPAGMPKPVTAKLENAVRSILSSPTFLDRHPALRGWTIVASDGRGLTEAVREQTPIIGAMMKTAGVVAE
jgi:tripartite-type tricarboxylate transporter receptor subunit TctC